MTIQLQGKATITMLINGESVVVEVDGDNAPITAGNFVDLVDRGIYENTKFHRVVRYPNDFVVQGGDPQSQDPDVSFLELGGGGFIDPATGQRRNIPLEIKPEGGSEPLYNELLPPELPPELRHEQGVIAMARSSEPDSASSQFYFTLAETSFLDGQYAVFGRVLEGFEAINQLETIVVPGDPQYQYLESEGLLSEVEVVDEQEKFLDIAGVLSEVQVTEIDSMLITGTTEDDTLIGTSFNDRFEGLQGNDQLNGGSGKDTMLGGSGNDILRGGGGRDRIFASSGNDTLNGEGGNDYLDGGSGRNRVTGGKGNDTLTSSMTGNILTGSQGSDTFVFDGFGVEDSRSDRLEDFQSDNDLIVLALAEFDGDFSPGQLPEEQFVIGSDGRGIIYDPDTGILSYRSDFSQEIAVLTGTPAISASDIQIV